MNVYVNYLCVVNCVLVLFSFENRINSLQYNVMSAFYPKSGSVLGKTTCLNNKDRKKYHNEMKSYAGLSLNERYFLQKKIKENLLDLLKNYHASSMSWR